MIEAASFLNELSQKRMKQVRLFMINHNHSGLSFNITSDPVLTEARDVDITYSSESFESEGLKADVTLRTWHGPASFRTSLFHGAVGLLTLLADQPRWLESMRELDPSETAAWSTFDLDPRDILRDDLRPVKEGQFIAPRGPGFVQFYVDTHGELSIEAEASQLAVLIFRLAAQRAIRALRVDEKFGRYGRLVRSEA